MGVMNNEDSRSYYDILQILPTAETEIIDVVYRRLCKKYHPDVNKKDTNEQIIRSITEAYSVLGDPTSRAIYDKLLLSEQTENRETNVDYRKTGKSIEKNNETAKKKEKEEIGVALDKVLTYFGYLSEGHIHGAYQLLCTEDKGKVPLKDFVEWQEAVNHLYQIGDINATLFRVHHKKNGLSLIEILVEGREIDLEMDDIKTVRIIKNVIKENNGWFLKLGYDEVRGLTAKFRLMAESRHPRVVGVDELLILAEHEVYRYKRFRIPFTIVVFRVLSGSGYVPVGLWEAKVLSWVSHSMDALRLTDVLARVHTGDCMLLLPHTDVKQAEMALSKLSDFVKKFANAEGADVNFVLSVDQYNGQDMSRWFTQLIDEVKK